MAKSATLRSATGPAPGDIGLNPVSLSTFGLRREPPRSIDDRQPGYESLFEYDTLFFDVFWAADGGSVVCLGPPLLNNEAVLRQAVFRMPGSSVPLKVDYHPHRSNLQPSCRFVVSGSGSKNPSQIVLSLCGRDAVLPVSPAGRAQFAERRVIVTLSKDNPLAWVRDWAEFNVRVHGADAVLLYDNGSTLYTRDALEAELASIPGLAEHLVVPWHFPYGPGVFGRSAQDSFYCQPGMLEHARHRYLAAARSVLNTDIDELVVTDDGKSIFARVEDSGSPAMIFPGVWAEMTQPRYGSPPGLVRHKDCVYGRRSQWYFRKLRRAQRLLRTKWVAVPSRCDGLDWCVHDLLPRHAAATSPSRPVDVAYRHFRQINTGWKTARARLRPYERLRHRFDRKLARAFALAFPEQEAAVGDQ